MADKDLLADFEDVECVIADPLRFKLRLGIGEEAYATLKITKIVQQIWGVRGAAVAGAGASTMPIVATTFFPSTGILSSIGLGATAVTPVGWIIGAAVLSGGAYYGVMSMFGQFTSSRVHTIPKFINTPIDLLGANLLDLMAPLALKIADCSDGVEQVELDAINEYFQQEWGFDTDYLNKVIPLLELNIRQLTLRDLATGLAEFQSNNKDCNHAFMRRELITFLREIAQADGQIDESEEISIDFVDNILGRESGGPTLAMRAVSGSLKNVGGFAKNLVGKIGRKGK